MKFSSSPPCGPCSFCPHVAGVGMHGHALGVAVPVGVDLRQCAGFPNKRVVRRHPAIVVQSHGCAVVLRQILRRMRGEIASRGPLPIAQRDEQIAGLVEGEATTPHRAAIGPIPRLAGVEDLLRAREPVVLEAASRHGEVAEAVGAGLDIADVEQPVGGKGRMQHHVADTRLLAAVLRGGAVAEEEDVGQASHRLLQQHALANDTQATRPLGDEHVAVWREGHREGMDEAIDEDLDAEVVQRGTDDRRCRGAGAAP